MSLRRGRADNPERVAILTAQCAGRGTRPVEDPAAKSITYVPAWLPGTNLWRSGSSPSWADRYVSDGGGGRPRDVTLYLPFYRMHDRPLHGLLGRVHPAARVVREDE